MNAVGEPEIVATVVNPLHKSVAETAAGPAPLNAGVGAAAAPAGPVKIVSTGGGETGGHVAEVRFKPDGRGTTSTENRSMLQQVTDTIIGSVSVAGSRTKDLARGVLLRKALRVVTTVTLWCSLLLLLHIFNVYRTFDETGAFDPSSTLQLDVGGCDVRLVSGSAASVRITGSLLHQGSAGAHALDFDSGQEYVRSVYASSDGCDSHPQGRW